MKRFVSLTSAAAFLVVLIQLCLLGFAIDDVDIFRSQNALYHSRLASLYAEGVNPESLGVLAHSRMQGQFVDQHWLFHRALSLLQIFLSPTVALLTLSILGLLVLSLMIFRTLRETPVSLRILIPLCLPWLLVAPYTRFISTRPGLWSSVFLLLAILVLRKNTVHKKDQAGLFLIAAAWSAFSLLAWLLIPVAVFFAVFKPQFRIRQLAIQCGVLGTGLLLGSLIAQGADFFWFSAQQILQHPLGKSGVYEWGPAPHGLLAPLFPLLLHFFILFMVVRRSLNDPQKLRTALASWGGVLALGTFLSALSLIQQRWIELAWPITLLNVGWFLGEARILNWQLASPRRQGLAFALGLTLLISLVVFPKTKHPQTDGSANPRLLNFLGDVQRKFPSFATTPILTLDWTAWSTDFYLNPRTKMEPGFSLGLYPADGEFLQSYRSLSHAPPALRLEQYAKLLQLLKTDFVIAREQDVRGDLQEDWFETLYRSGGWVLARVHTTLQPMPEQWNGRFDGRERVFALCQLQPFAVKHPAAPAVFPKTKTDCEDILQPWAQAMDRKTQAEILKFYFKPQKFRSFRQLESPTNRGFFAYFDPATRQFFDEKMPGANAEDLEAVQVIRASFHETDFEIRGRRLAFPDPRQSQICDAYQNLAAQMVRHATATFKLWTADLQTADALRSRLAFGILCSRSPLIRLRDKAQFTDVCLEFKSRLDKEITQLTSDLRKQKPGDWSERLIIDMLALQHGLESPLKDVGRTELLKRGRVVTNAVTFNGRTENIRDRQSEVFTSGHYAVWWTLRWQKLREQGLVPSAQEHDDFENFAGLYEKIWRHDFEYNSFAIRWWSEALVNAFAQAPSPQTSHWMEQFFRAASTFTKGSTIEHAPECLGPHPPGIGPMPYPDHNAGLLLEALEQARRVNFDWWSETEEQMLRQLLSCTLSLQKSKIFWPADQAGEIAWSTGDGTYRADVQAHALNALGLRIENDQITCPQ